jgi:hypothetical protein
MDRLEWNFISLDDYFGYGGNVKVSVDGVVSNKPGIVKDVAVDFRLESLDEN